MPTPHADLEENHRSLSAWWEWIPTIVLSAFLPLGALCRLIVIQYGARAYAPGAGLRLLTCAFVHGFITCPVLAYPLVSGEPKWADRRWRPLLVVGLLSAPLLSLCYYLGDFRDAWQAVDAVIAILPAVAIAVLQYQRRRSPTGFVMVLAVTTFVPLFLVADVLAPWPAFFVFESQGGAIYLWRSLAAAAGVWLAFDAYLREAGRPLDADLARALLAVLAAAASLLGIAPGAEGPLPRVLPATLLILLAIPFRKFRLPALLLATTAAAGLAVGIPSASWAAPLRLAMLALGVAVVFKCRPTSAKHRRTF